MGARRPYTPPEQDGGAGVRPWCAEVAFGERARPRPYQATSGLRRGGGRPVIVRPRLDVARCPRCGALAALCSRARGKAPHCDDTGLLALRAMEGRA